MQGALIRPHQLKLSNPTDATYASVKAAQGRIFPSHSKLDFLIRKIECLRLFRKILISFVAFSLLTGLFKLDFSHWS
jgi:hypothetical protein